MAIANRLSTMVRALRHRNYRLFFFGQAISLMGTWLTQVATSWLVYRLTGSAFLLGLSGFASQAPLFFLGPFAGVLVDRFDRRKILLLTQVAAMLQSTALATLALMGKIDVAHVLWLNLLQGLINVLDMPARQAMLVEMIEDRGDLPNAVALNSSIVNVARLVGPSVGGLLIAAAGEGVCFTLDAISYIAVIASLLALKLRVVPRRRDQAPVLRQLRDGMRYAYAFPPIRAVLTLLAVASLMGMPYSTLMPMIVRTMFHGDAKLLGFMMASSGVGALTGALYLASRSSVLGLGRIIATSAFAFAVALVALPSSHSIALSLPLMAIAGGAMMVQMAASNTVLQTIVDEDRRGRVMSLYAVAVFGTTPFGSVLAGSMADRFGAPATLAVGGFACLLNALYFLRCLPHLRQHVRPIYERLGILPELASGVAGATDATSAGASSSA